MTNEKSHPWVRPTLFCALIFALIFVAVGCSEDVSTGVGAFEGADGASKTRTGEDTLYHATPLTDMGSALYLGFQGGLYPGGKNNMPKQHSSVGVTFANEVQPLAADGTPSDSGEVVFLSLGISNASQEFKRFISLAKRENGVSDHLTILNAAGPGQVAETYTDPVNQVYDDIVTQVLEPEGVTEQQVQVIWVKAVNRDPVLSLPDPGADAYTLEMHLGDILRALKVRYPNLKQVFLTSRIYGGYAADDVSNPEPFAYESGFSVKWVIEAQLRQMYAGRIDHEAGDLDYNTVAPWVAWAPYMWADGTNPRSDGLFWEPADFEADGSHPSPYGENKYGEYLLDFFSKSSLTACWFLDRGVCK